MAPRYALENIQYNILAAAESGLPPSKALLQPSAGKQPLPKRSRSRLTSSSLTLWGLLCLLVVSLTILRSNVGYMLTPNGNNIAVQAAAKLETDSLENSTNTASSILTTPAVTTTPETQVELVKVAKKNERSTLEQSQSSEEDKILLQAIKKLKAHPWPKILPPVKVLASSPDTCAEATKTPKVAILFLTKGNLFHEPTWKEWFRSAAGVLPTEHAAALEETLESEEENPCRTSTDDTKNDKNIKDTDIIASQHLFNVYIHAPPSFNGKLRKKEWKINK
jgi:hypothetical protein